MKNKKFTAALCVFILLFVIAEYSSADGLNQSDDKKAGRKLWAQEPSQIAIALLIAAELATLNKIQDDQVKMLKKWNSSDVEKSRNKILENIKNARDILAKSAAFNYLANDIDAIMKDRFPEWTPKMTIAQAAQRINDRQTKWKSSVKAHLKSMNATTSHLADDIAMRDALMKILKKPEGQVQAIQALGGFFDNMHLTLTRDESVIQGLMSAMIEYRNDAKDERNDLEKAVNEAGTYMKNHKITSKKRKIGF